MRKLFLVGCPRSGTPMVQQALNRHSMIVIPPETKFFFSFFAKSRRQQIRHLARLNKDLGIHLHLPPGRVCTTPEGRAFYESIAAQYTQLHAKPDALVFGDKTPEHTSYLPRIRELFPDAKILFVYRDGRDVALSLSRMPWMSSNLYVCFKVWLYYQRMVRDALDCFGTQVHLARYEDIVADPTREFSRITRFLDLPYESAVADGHGNRDGIPEREYAWKARALERITSDRVGLFERDLTGRQIGILERLGRETLLDFGYSLTTDGKDPLPFGFHCKLFYHMSRFALGLPWHAVARESLMWIARCRAGKQPPRVPIPILP
jgi:hypothetical protein